MHEIIREWLNNWLSGAGIIYLTGLIIFAVWLLRNSLGKDALRRSRPRRTFMAAYVPIVVLLVWFVLSAAAMLIVRRWFEASSNELEVFHQHIANIIGSVLTITVILILAERYFVRGLGGFGLTVRWLGWDIFYAALNLLAAIPLVAAMLILVRYTGRIFIDPQFEIQPHPELEFLRVYPTGATAITIFVNAVIITPLLEEMLFRGLFQSMIRSYLPDRPWLTVILSSVLFTTAHADMAHWPGLFVLGMFMGYAYEKSSSLVRVIIIHGLFNAITVLSVMLTAG